MTNGESDMGMSYSLVMRLDDDIYLHKVWRSQASTRVVSLDLFSSFLLVLYDLQVELFLLKRVPKY